MEGAGSGRWDRGTEGDRGGGSAAGAGRRQPGLLLQAQQPRAVVQVHQPGSAPGAQEIGFDLIEQDRPVRPREGHAPGFEPAAGPGPRPAAGLYGGVGL